GHEIRRPAEVEIIEIEIVPGVVEVNVGAYPEPVVEIMIIAGAGFEGQRVFKMFIQQQHRSRLRRSERVVIGYARHRVEILLIKRPLRLGDVGADIDLPEIDAVVDVCKGQGLGGKLGREQAGAHLHDIAAIAVYVPDEVDPRLDIFGVEGNHMGIHAQLLLQQRVVRGRTAHDLAIPTQPDGEVQVRAEVGLHLRENTELYQRDADHGVRAVERDLSVEPVREIL